MFHSSANRVILIYLFTARMPLMSRLTIEERNDLKLWARIHVRSGYEPVEEIEEILLDLCNDFESPLSERDRLYEIRSIVIQAIRDLREDQLTWPVLTDSDRLELAFDILEDNGIVARQNFTCCGTCGASEIVIEMEDYEVCGRPARGYAFFHQQDTESAVENGNLYLSYGATNTSDEDVLLKIGQEVFRTLKSVGLDTHWDGQLDHRIGINMQWQRRWEGAIPKPMKRWPF